VRIRVEVPGALSDEARDLLGKVEQALGEDAYPERKAFRARARSTSGG
jgi:hypothetical protein